MARDRGGNLQTITDEEERQLIAFAIWHATLIEMLWTLIGVIGMYFGVHNLSVSRADIKRLQEMNGNRLAAHDVMRVIAYGHFRNDTFRLAKHSTITMIGLFSMLLPPAPGTSSHVTPAGATITAGFFTISILLVLASALDRKQREALEEMK